MMKCPIIENYLALMASIADLETAFNEQEHKIRNELLRALVQLRTLNQKALECAAKKEQEE